MKRSESEGNPTYAFNRSGLALGALAAIPIVETLIYNAHVGPGKSVLSAFVYVEIAVASLLLFSLMIVTFLLERRSFRQMLEALRQRFNLSREILAQRLVYALFALPILFLALFFGGKRALEFLLRSGILVTVLLPLLQLCLVVLLLWFIARLLQSLARGFANLESALTEWGFSIRVSIVFYLMLLGCTFKFVGLEGIKKTAQLDFCLGIAKDYLLLFIIAGMLYAGLYKVSRAGSLRELFQTSKGFLHFTLMCGVIAILAIWADFNGKRPEIQEEIFKFDWQKQYNSVHVYVRDIGLLLVPIAALLFWSLKRLAEELKEEKSKYDSPS